jgi:hypothetical protein
MAMEVEPVIPVGIPYIVNKTVNIFRERLPVVSSGYP